MKGQAIFEFLVAGVVFFGIVIYIIAYLGSSMAAVGADAYSNELESKAMQVSEIILKSPGEWAGTVPIKVGLASDDGWPHLDKNRVGWLADYCDVEIVPGGYDAVLNMLGLKEDVSGIQKSMIFQLKIGGDKKCGPLDAPNTEKGTVTRFVVMDGDITNISVSVW